MSKMPTISLREIAFSSPEYKHAVELRYLVLRKPINLTFTPADLVNDTDDIHLAAFDTSTSTLDTNTTAATTHNTHTSASTLIATLVLHPTTTTTTPPAPPHATSHTTPAHTADTPHAAIKMRQVAVAPHCQGQGVGRKLVVWSEQVARERGYRVMVLHARKTAVGFYLSLGYRCVGDEFTEVGIQHQRMEKALL